MKVFLFFVSICIIISCNEPTIDPGIKNSLMKSGKNRSELIKVIDYYGWKKKDSLKLRAANYLISNLEDRYYFEGNLLDKYMLYSKLVLRDLDAGPYIMSSLNRKYGSFSHEKINVKYDLREIKAEQLISTIDMAFKVWEEQPWGKDYSFDQFCKYILPHRVNDEIPDYNREEIYEMYNHLLDSVRLKNGDAMQACIVLNNKLRKDGWILSSRASFLPNFSASHLIANRVGTCRDMADLPLHIMRAVGVPVAQDFIPQWAYRNIGHTFNVVLDKNGKHIPFLGAEDSPGTPHRPGAKRGKVYRNTFEKNLSSLAAIKSPEDFVPEFLTNPRILDVTNEYSNCFSLDISLPIIPQTNNKYAYLCVFDNKSWVPIGWSKVKDKEASFDNFEAGIVYLPAYYSEDGVIPAQFPFVFGMDGEPHYLTPDTNRLIKQMNIKRLYPNTPEMFVVDDAMGGTFQGANSSDFRDAVDLYHFLDRALPYWNNIPVKSDQKFRFFRFVSSSKKPCNVSEIEIYSNHNKKLKGLAIGSDNDGLHGSNIENAFDGDINTFFNASSNSSWVGMDFGTEVSINEVRFVSKLDVGADMLINADEEYELKYWKDGDWKILGEQVAKGNALTFNNIPSNSLFLLHNKTKSVEERIFVYEDGEQVWY